MSRRGEADLGQPFSEVFDPAFQLGVEILEVRAATGRVDHECVEVSAAISLHVRVAQPLRPFQVTVVREQRPAASLRRREPYLASGKLQQLDRGIVRLRVEDGHHAPDEERDAMLTGADGGRHVSRGPAEGLAQRG